PERTALGPPTSPRPGTIDAMPPDPAPHDHDIAGAEAAVPCTGDVPAPPLIHIPRRYWDSETTFTRNLTAAQSGPYAPLPVGANGRRKDHLAELPAGPATERGGVIAVDVQRALRASPDAWLSASLDTPAAVWTHT